MEKQKKYKKRILILTFSFPAFSGNDNNDFFGGSFLVPEALSYHKAGAKVTVLTMHIPGLPLKEKIKKNLNIVRVPYFLPLRFQKIRIPNYPLYTKKFFLWRLFQLPFFIAAYLVFLCKYVQECDIVHANWTPTALLALPFSFLFRRPIFLTFRGSDITMLPIFFNKHIIKHMDGVFNWKLGDVSKYIKLFKGNYMNLPLISSMKSMNSNENIQFAKQNDIIIFTFIGRLTEDNVQLLKGLDIIIPAAAKLLNEFGQRGKFQVHLLGDGPFKKKLKRMVVQSHLSDHVFFQGFQNNIFPFLQKTNAVMGGIGLNAVVQEAAFSERLLIMIGGDEWTGDIWKDKSNSLLYKPHNIDSLVKVMNYVIDNPESCKKIAEEGHKTIKKYATNIDKGGPIYLDCFDKLIARKRKSNS